MKKQTTLVASLVVAGTLAFGAPMAAQAYPAPTPDEPVVNGSVVPGGTVSIAFSGFEANETIALALTGESALSATLATIVKTAVETQTGSTTADADGAAIVNVTLPENAVGTYTLTATGSISGLVQTATFTVGTDNGNGDNDNDLSPTGNDVSAAGLWIGGGALLLGGGAVTAAAAVRRQRKDG